MKEIKLIKKDNELILMEEEKEIEKYDYNKSINFEKLIKYLIQDKLENEINIILDEENFFSNEEKRLCEIIKTIIDEYNKRVNEFLDFCCEQNI